MAETVVPGPICDLSAVREATCIHTKKIFDSCQSKDCIEDLRLYPTKCAQEIIDQAQSIKCARATLLYVQVNVEPMGFNRGYYCVDLRYYYKVTADAFSGCCRTAEITGLAVYDKRAVLFGSEGTTKVFASGNGCDINEAGAVLGCSLPTAVVEAVDPIVLDIRLCDVRERPKCGEIPLNDIPAGIRCAFDDEICLENCTNQRVYLTLGQFSILRLERDAQLLIPVYDNCIPDKECTCEHCQADPCDVFQRLSFPVNQFFPASCAEELDPISTLQKCCQ